MDSCSCGQPKTLGQLLDSYSASATGEALPQGFSKQLFGPVYNKSLCDLYASSSEEGFAGHCEVTNPAPLDSEHPILSPAPAADPWRAGHQISDTFPYQGLHAELTEPLNAVVLPAGAFCCESPDWDCARGL